MKKSLRLTYLKFLLSSPPATPLVFLPILYLFVYQPHPLPLRLPTPSSTSSSTNPILYLFVYQPHPLRLPPPPSSLPMPPARRNAQLDCIRRLPLAAQALAIADVGPTAYRREGPGVLYSATRTLPGGAAVLKLGHTSNFRRRRAQYNNCAAPGSPIAWHFTYAVPDRLTAERLAHLLLEELGAKIPPAPCPGLRRLHSHREWFDLNAIGGLPGFERVLRRLFRRLGVPFNQTTIPP
ncbi:hypothetical protein DFH09DRAFT_1313022 [Mycena vulgaris]|nr:hypothetical protein DFH09DRAFT_1313022 [Mycena vulgaris]